MSIAAARLVERTRDDLAEFFNAKDPSQIVFAQNATSLRASPSHHVVGMSSGQEIAARAVMLATGVSWRRLGIAKLEELIGAGVFYGAAASEARAMRGRHVCVVGAGNSAGQAASHLAKYADEVVLLVRGELVRDLLVQLCDEGVEIAVEVETQSCPISHHGDMGPGIERNLTRAAGAVKGY